MPFSFLRVLVAALLSLGAASAASADIVVFKTGRTMSVAAARVEGDRVLISLRSGGEADVALAVVERIDPDEVPYPAPVAALTAASDAGIGNQASDAVLTARPFGELIATAAATHGLDPRLVHAVIEVESNYQPRARSRKGAKGLMQLMPATARQYAVGDPYDPRSNIEGGVRHLKDLLTRFDISLALAAYNAGEATIRRYGGVPPFPETRAYVARVLSRLSR